MFRRKKKTPLPDDPRERMVREQLERRGIRDAEVLAAFRTIAREPFVPPRLRDRAYEDRPLPIGKSQTISQPYIAALMTEASELRAGLSVLEIGTGSGFQTAILNALAGEVVTIERRADLSATARHALEENGYARGVRFVVGDGSLGFDEESPYDRILVTAAAPSIPTPLLEQLKPGGILISPVGDRMAQRLVRVERRPDGFDRRDLCPCVFVPLLGKGGFSE